MNLLNFQFLLLIILPSVCSQDITVGYVGSDTTIDCPVQGNYTYPTWSGPPGNVLYYDRGSQIFNPVIVDRYRWAGNQRSLILLGTRKTDDGGLYKCSVQSPTLINGETILTVRDITVGYTGSDTTIDCPVDGDYTYPSWRGPPNNVNYYDAGLQQFNPILQNRYTWAGNNRSLILLGTRKSDDGGMYTCYFWSSTLLQRSTTLKVRTNPNAPALNTSAISDSNGIRASEGRPLTVQCVSRGGYPAPTVALYLGNISGQPLATVDTGTPSGDTFTVTLTHTFVPQRQHDRQWLICRSYYPTPPDAQDSQNKSALLFMNLKPSKPLALQTSEAVAGNTMTVECITSGSRPEASISWMFKGDTYTPAVTASWVNATETFITVSRLQRNVASADNGEMVQCEVSHRSLEHPFTEQI